MSSCNGVPPTAPVHRVSTRNKRIVENEHLLQKFKYQLRFGLLFPFFLKLLLQVNEQNSAQSLQIHRDVEFIDIQLHHLIYDAKEN